MSLTNLTKKELYPIANFFKIKNISKMNKKFLIDSILDFETNKQFPTLILDLNLEKPKLYKSCQTCNKTNFITHVNVIVCKYCCTPYGYI